MRASRLMKRDWMKTIPKAERPPVTETHPASIPFMRASRLMKRDWMKTIPKAERPPVAAPMAVIAQTRPAREELPPEAARTEPPLKPNHPSTRRRPPEQESTRL